MGARAGAENAQLWSRGHERIISSPHIEAELRRYFPTAKVDGELYNHQYKDNFEYLMHLIEQKTEPDPEHKIIEYHIYDLNIPDTPFKERFKILTQIFRGIPTTSPLKLVKTFWCATKEDMIACYESFLEEGYEGAMLRNPDAFYKKGRQVGLQKLKLFEDAEFQVVDIIEGKGKLRGHVGSFVCLIVDEHGSRTFKVKVKGEQRLLKDAWEDHSIWTNKLLTVQFQGYTKKNKVPRIPVGLRFRNPNF